jgi:hypothetical protein
MRRNTMTEVRNLANHSNRVPARHFSFPHEVIDDPSLSSAQKRAILCEWVSDACAVPSCPTLRLLPGTTFPVTFSAAMDALQQLDRRTAAHKRSRHSFERGAAVVPMRGIQVSMPAP